MIIPKRFKLHKAAAQKPRPETGLHLDAVHVIDDHFLVTDGNCAAKVPINGGQDMPRKQEKGESWEGALPLGAVREAVKGKTGEGLLYTLEGKAVGAASPNKAHVVHALPEPYGQRPNFDAAFEQTKAEAPVTHDYVEVSLDAELLYNIAQAIGAEEAVKLRFLVNKESHVADAGGEAHGVIDVRPVREDTGGRGILMINVCNE